MTMLTRWKVIVVVALSSRLLRSDAFDKTGEATQIDGTNTSTTTAKPETITYRMTVLDSLHNDTELYNTTSGSVIIVGRSAKARAKLFANDPTTTNYESRNSGFRKAKIVNDEARFSTAPESRIVNKPENSFFPIRGFIPIIGVPEKNREEPPPDHFVPNEFYSGKNGPVYNGPNRNGPADFPPERQESQNPEQSYFPRKPQGPSKPLPPIVRPDFHRPKKTDSHFANFEKSKHEGSLFKPAPSRHDVRPAKNIDEGRGPFNFGNALGATYAQGYDVPADVPFAPPREECVCVPFYLCKNGYVASPRTDVGPSPLRPGGFGPQPPFGGGGGDLLIPIDERSNDKSSDVIVDVDNGKQTTENSTESQVESRMKRQASNQTRSALEAPPAYATDIMQRMLGVNFAHCGVLRTCCKIPQGAPVPSFGLAPPGPAPPQQDGPGPIPPEILAQLFPKKPAFGIPPKHNTFGPNFPVGLKNHPPHRLGPPVPGLLPGPLFPAPSVGVLGPVYPKPQPYPQPRPDLLFPTCGARNAFGIHGRVKSLHYPESGADFAEFPWHAGIMKRLGPQESLYVCGGTLIASQWIATVAHCLKTLRPQDIKIRLGEWDVNRDDEFYAHVEKLAAQIVIHPEFFPGNLNNDLALIRLDSPVDLNLPHIGAACLPEPRENFGGHRCWVTGWGKDTFGHQGEYQNILKKVDVPVVGHDDCEERLKRTRLGPYYQLHPGFVCAGGEPGKDACTGDGGSPLVCEYNGLWKAVGLVSWGIGCGQAGVPGVYVNLAQYREWIDSVISGLG